MSAEDLRVRLRHRIIAIRALETLLLVHVPMAALDNLRVQTYYFRPHSTLLYYRCSCSRKTCSCTCADAALDNLRVLTYYFHPHHTLLS